MKQEIRQKMEEHERDRQDMMEKWKRYEIINRYKYSSNTLIYYRKHSETLTIFIRF